MKNTAHKPIKIYMAITNDKYELPLAIEEDSTIMARKFGIKQCTLLSYISTGRNKGSKIKFIRLFLEEEEDEKENQN